MKCGGHREWNLGFIQVSHHFFVALAGDMIFAKFVLLVSLLVPVLAQIGVQNGNWGLQTNGTYRNPIIAGDYS